MQGTPIPFTVPVFQLCITKIEYGCRCSPIPDCMHEKVKSEEIRNQTTAHNL